MVELNHSPETCIVARDGSSHLDAESLRDLREIAIEHGAYIVDGWAFPVGHQLWYVVDAPESHIAADVFSASRAYRWNTVRINPVMNHDSFSRKVLDGLIEESESTQITGSERSMHA